MSQPPRDGYKKGCELSQTAQAGGKEWVSKGCGGEEGRGGEGWDQAGSQGLSLTGQAVAVVSLLPRAGGLDREMTRPQLCLLATREMWD